MAISQKLGIRVRFLLLAASVSLFMPCAAPTALAQDGEVQTGALPFEPEDQQENNTDSIDSALPQPDQVNSDQRDFNLENAERNPPSPPDSNSDEFNPFLQEETVIQKTPQQVEAEIRDAAFNAALTGLMPMRPSDIRKLLETYDETRQAIETPIYPFPQPELTTETVSLDPGSTPPEIKVAANHVTTVNIMDITGKPWPIKSISMAGNFDVTVEGGAGGHRIMITPMSHFAYGNIAVSLLEFDTPIVFTIKTHRDVVQYRFDARMPEFGPYAQVPIIENSLGITAGNGLLSSILDGVPPDGSEKLDVSGVDGRTTAYNLSGSTYVRTPLTLLSPGWTASVSSADGMNVYAVSNAPVLLLSDKGQMVHAKLSEKKVSDE